MTRPNTEPNPQLHSRSDPWYVCYVQLCYVFGLCEEEIVPEKKDYTNFPMNVVPTSKSTEKNNNVDDNNYE